MHKHLAAFALGAVALHLYHTRRKQARAEIGAIRVLGPDDFDMHAFDTARSTETVTVVGGNGPTANPGTSVANPARDAAQWIGKFPDIDLTASTITAGLPLGVD